MMSNGVLSFLLANALQREGRIPFSPENVIDFLSVKITFNAKTETIKIWPSPAYSLET